MYHPNAELGRCTNQTQELKVWDQRIPNEPIANRQFLFERPPVLYRVPPLTTNQCIPAPPQLMILTPTMEFQSANYWDNNLRGKKYEGLPTDPSLQKKKERTDKLKKLIQRHPDRPWLHGVNINIDAESKLRGLDYYNPEDCIDSTTLKKLEEKNNESHVAMFHRYHTISNNYPNETPHWLNNPTKMINQEPLDYDYANFLNRCAVNRHMPSIGGGTDNVLPK